MQDKLTFIVAVARALATDGVLAPPFGLASIAQRKCIKKFIPPPNASLFFCNGKVSFRYIEPIISDLRVWEPPNEEMLFTWAS